MKVFVLVFVLIWVFYVIRYFYCHDYEHITSNPITIDRLSKLLLPGDIVFIGGMETSLGGTFGWGGLLSAFLNQYHFHPTLITSGLHPKEKWVWEFNAKPSKRKEKMAFDSSDHIYKMNISDYLKRYKDKFPLASFEIYRSVKHSLKEKERLFNGHEITSTIKSFDKFTYGWNIGSILGFSEGGDSMIHCNEFVGKILEQTGITKSSQNSPFDYLPGNLKSKLEKNGFTFINKVRLH